MVTTTTEIASKNIMLSKRLPYLYKMPRKENSVSTESGLVGWDGNKRGFDCNYANKWITTMVWLFTWFRIKHPGV